MMSYFFIRRRIDIIAGNKIGGAKAAATNKAKYGSSFYKRIGAKGGKNGHTGGFYANRELASSAGKVGGRVSRRKPKVNVIPEPVVSTPQPHGTFARLVELIIKRKSNG